MRPSRTSFISPTRTAALPSCSQNSASRSIGRLANAGLLDAPVARIVICGGGSEIPGLQSFAEGILKRPVREGRPRKVAGLPPLFSSAAFAGVVGVLSAGSESAANDLLGADGADAPLGYIGRVGQWLRDGF